MKTFPLIISSPDGDLFRGDAEMLILRGTEGDLAIMAGHVPFVTAVVRSNCVVITDTEERKEGVIESGADLEQINKKRRTGYPSALFSKAGGETTWTVLNNF